jgi:UDP-N-acetyl-D-mannosaminuronic acid dehydrogenase
LTADVVIVVIGTPVDEHLSPDPNTVVASIQELSPYLNIDQLLVLRSTVFPGVSKKISEYLAHTLPGIDLAYCPERIVEGNALFELTSLPQIIGVSEDPTFARASLIFEQLGVSTVKCSMEEAELAKLYTNVWRYIKFAIANQFWMMSNDLNVDYENVRHAISFEYPRAADIPGAGFAAGPCLFKDTMQLSALVQQNFPLGQSAMMINEGTPGYVVSRLERKYKLNELTVGILGMAFKGDVDDVRSSLAFKLRKLLAFKCKEVLMHDPFVLDKRFVDYEEIIEKSDVLIIGAPHSLYKLLDTDKPVIDIWNLLQKGVLI